MAISAKILYKNLAQDGSIAGVSSGGLTIINLLDPDTSTIWRGDGDTNHIITGDFGGAGLDDDGRLIDALALSHHCHADHEIRIRLYTNNSSLDADKVYDTKEAFIQPMDVSKASEEFDSTDLTDDGHLLDDISTDRKLYIRHIEPVQCTNYSLTIITDANFYPEADYLFIGQSFTTGYNITRDYSVYDIDNSTHRRGKSRHAYVVKGPQMRAMDISWEAVTENEYLKLRLLNKRIGKREPVIVSVHPGRDDYTSFLDSIYGLVAEQPVPVRRVDTQEAYYTASMQVVEH